MKEPESCYQASGIEEKQAETIRRALAAGKLKSEWDLVASHQGGRWMVYMGKFPDTEFLDRKRGELRLMNIDFDRAGGGFEPGLSLGRSLPKKPRSASWPPSRARACAPPAWCRSALKSPPTRCVCPRPHPPSAMKWRHWRARICCPRPCRHVRSDAWQLLIDELLTQKGLHLQAFCHENQMQQAHPASVFSPYGYWPTRPPSSSWRLRWQSAW